MFSDIESCLAWVMAKKGGLGFDYFKLIMTHKIKSEKTFKVIHVAGTNGKGSVVNYINTALCFLGYQTVSMRSPHFLSHLDRICFNYDPIQAQTFLDIINQNYSFIVRHQLNMFQIDFLVMYELAKQKQVDYLIMETGIGGLRDNTNILDDCDLSIIVSIGYDHQDILGQTLSEIAYQKAGIIKKDSACVLGQTSNEVFKVIQTYANNMNSVLLAPLNYQLIDKQIIKYHDVIFDLTSDASYQVNNLTVALNALKYLLGEQNFNQNLSQLPTLFNNHKWHGRFEILNQNPYVIVDGAHNVDGILALKESLTNYPKPLTIIFAALKDKDYTQMLNILNDFSDYIILTKVNSPRCFELDTIKESPKMMKCESFKKALDISLNKSQTIVFCGSLYFISDVYLYIKEKFNA